MDKLQFDGPVVLAVLDGVGLAPDGPGNAVSKARTLFLGQASRIYPHIALEASGEAVGLIPGQMGNSEVGHNTMGCGRAFKQGIARINEEFRTGKVFDSDAWRSVVTRLQHEESATLHFAGIFSDGGVHSHISHLEQMISKAYNEGKYKEITVKTGKYNTYKEPKYKYKKVTVKKWKRISVLDSEFNYYPGGCDYEDYKTMSKYTKKGWTWCGSFYKDIDYGDGYSVTKYYYKFKKKVKVTEKKKIRNGYKKVKYPITMVVSSTQGYNGFSIEFYDDYEGYLGGGLKNII